MTHPSWFVRARYAAPEPVKNVVLRLAGRNRDLQREARRQAFQSSARLVAGTMASSQPFTSRIALLDHALSLAPEEGIVAEFGVYLGKSLRRIAKHRPEAHGFDSFEGLPEAWRDGSMGEGAFALDRLPDVGSASLHVGWFNETIPAFLDAHDGNVALLHLDADLYSSTKIVLDSFAARLVPGSILLFDEYFNYPGWEAHEHRAFREFLDDHGRAARYVGYNSRGQQVAVAME
jgi:hypothetical protein